MKSKLGAFLLAVLFTAAVAWTAHAGDACCGAAAAADKAGVENPAAGEKGAATAPCAHMAGGDCQNCEGPDKCPHHEDCSKGCDCAPSGGSDAKPEAGEGQ